MIYFAGKVYKSHSSKYWLIEVPDLDVMTQGVSRNDALIMIKDAVEALTGEEGIEVTVDKGSGDTFYLGSADTKTLLALMLKRRRIKSRLTLKDVASKLGARSINSYAQYEHGKSEPSLTKIQEILNAIEPGKKTVLKVA